MKSLTIKFKTDDEEVIRDTQIDGELTLSTAFSLLKFILENYALGLHNGELALWKKQLMSQVANKIKEAMEWLDFCKHQWEMTKMTVKPFFYVENYVAQAMFQCKKCHKLKVRDL